MLGENKNLKDISKDSVKDTPFLASTAGGSSSLVPSWQNHSGSYTKTNKLITALYMVTDTMEKDEPIRLKLRTLGTEILSDITMLKTLPRGTLGKVEEKIITILSFLNIAFDVGMISEMNCNILKKEFIELKQSIQDFTTQNHLWFEEFISKSPLLDEGGAGSDNSKITTSSFGHSSLTRRREFSKGQGLPTQAGTRIGVQKGSTLMKALRKIEGVPALQNLNKDREILKNKRRELLLRVIKNKPEGMSIKDILFSLRSLREEIGEKTLQRELISMIKDSVLKKTGEKRWSQYFLS